MSIVPEKTGNQVRVWISSGSCEGCECGAGATTTGGRDIIGGEGATNCGDGGGICEMRALVSAMDCWRALTQASAISRRTLANSWER